MNHISKAEMTMEILISFGTQLSPIFVKPSLKVEEAIHEAQRVFKIPNDTVTQLYKENCENAMDNTLTLKGNKVVEGSILTLKVQHQFYHIQLELPRGIRLLSVPVTSCMNIYDLKILLIEYLNFEYPIEDLCLKFNTFLLEDEMNIFEAGIPTSSAGGRIKGKIISCNSKTISTKNENIEITSTSSATATVNTAAATLTSIPTTITAPDSSSINLHILWLEHDYHHVHYALNRDTQLLTANQLLFLFTSHLSLSPDHTNLFSQLFSDDQTFLFQCQENGKTYNGFAEEEIDYTNVTNGSITFIFRMFVEDTSTSQGKQTSTTTLSMEESMKKESAVVAEHKLVVDEKVPVTQSQSTGDCSILAANDIATTTAMSEETVVTDKNVTDQVLTTSVPPSPSAAMREEIAVETTHTNTTHNDEQVTTAEEEEEVEEEHDNDEEDEIIEGDFDFEILNI
jgi:hypothetical protein